LASQYCITPAEVVRKARSAAGALGARTNDVIATALEVFRADGSPDGLGCAIAGELQKLEELTVAARNEAVQAARSAAGALGAVANDAIATALEVFRADGGPDGLGCAIAGGLQKLEELTVAARNEAVQAARSAAGALGAATKAGNVACERAAKWLGILDGAGNGDVVPFNDAGGLAKLEHLPLQKRIEAAEEARRKNSAAGNSAKQDERQVCDFNCVFDSNYGNSICFHVLYY
jgi:uncharacterized protein YbjQ (UPF0145 family)